MFLVKFLLGPLISLACKFEDPLLVFVHGFSVAGCSVSFVKKQCGKGNAFTVPFVIFQQFQILGFASKIESLYWDSFYRATLLLKMESFGSKIC